MAAAVREPEYGFVYNFQSSLIDESRATMSLWTNDGNAPTLEQVQQEGNLFHGVAAFNSPAGPMYGWFALNKQPSGNYSQRGYVIAPLSHANDGRTQQAINAVRQILTQQRPLALSMNGTAPAPNQSTEVEAVVALSGLTSALEKLPLAGEATPVALFKNGAASDPVQNLRGRWTRVRDGYMVEFDSGYTARLSDSCRLAVTVPVADLPQAPRTPTVPCVPKKVVIDHSLPSLERQCDVRGNCSYVPGPRVSRPREYTTGCP